MHFIVWSSNNYMNTCKTSDLIRLYTCKSVATKTGLLRNRKPILAGVLVYAVIKMKEKKINASSATIIYISHLTLPGFPPLSVQRLHKCRVTAFLFLFIWKFNGNSYLNH